MHLLTTGQVSGKRWELNSDFLTASDSPAAHIAGQTSPQDFQSTGLCGVIVSS